MTEPDLLVVAHRARWVYEDFLEAASWGNRGPTVKYTHGLDIPNVGEFKRPAYWTPTEFAARLKVNGVNIPLIAPGPGWLSTVPQRLLGRVVETRPLSWLRSFPRLMESSLFYWVKLAEMKHDKLPAQRTFLGDFVTLAVSLGAPDDTMIQYSYSNLPIVREDRCFVLDGKVITSAPYVQLGDIWNVDLDQSEWKPSKWAEDFAQYVVTTMGHRQPRAYTLDVALVLGDEDNQQGYHVVLEANPVWSSAIYGADPHKALEAVLAGVDYTRKSRWMWKPDPWLVKRAEYMVPLKYE